MSAPDSEPEKQVKRHRPSLFAIAAAVVVALALLLGFLTVVVERGATPDGATTQIDGRTGDVVAE
ncbi:hypothetical protein [Yoonia sp.]|uniref:hypothetical protein n=1 Tax=Yoonia sp. TaxID=2212373 RepID=UPI003F6B8B24